MIYLEAMTLVVALVALAFFHSHYHSPAESYKDYEERICSSST
jgi:hypothetical protein